VRVIKGAGAQLHERNAVHTTAFSSCEDSASRCLVSRVDFRDYLRGNDSIDLLCSKLTEFASLKESV